MTEHELRTMQCLVRDIQATLQNPHITEYMRESMPNGYAELSRSIRDARTVLHENNQPQPLEMNAVNSAGEITGEAEFRNV